MSILNKLTKKNLRLNIKRTIVTIIGIMLSTALICAVAGMTTSLQKTLVNMAIQQDGNFHIRFQDVEQEQLKYIQNNQNIDSYFLTSNVGWGYLKGSQNEYKPYISIKEFDSKALKESGLVLTEGRMPENSQEIVISESIENNAKVKLNVGDTITLELGERQTLDGEKLGEKDDYIIVKDEITRETIVKEKIANTETKTYKIVGKIERPNYIIEEYDSPGYTAISYLENVKETANISILYSNLKDYEEQTENILKTLRTNTGKEYEIIENSDLVNFQGGVSESTMTTLLAIGAVVILIIVVSSIFVIRNSFSISVSEKNKQYGMLSSIGATSKQIKRSVLFEGFLIGIIAIPLGIICGIVAIVVLLIVVNYLLGDMLNGLKFVYSVPILPILISILVSAITIYLSCLIPARKAAKISPIDAIRGSEDIKIKAKKLKTSKLTKKLFGIGGTIASKNLKRSRKKYRTTVISIVVSIVIFISLSSFLEYGKKATSVYYTEINYDLVLYNDKNNKNEDTLETYKKILDLETIEDYSYSYAASGRIDMEKYATEFGKKHFETFTGATEIGEEIEYKTEASISIVGINNEYFKKYLQEIGVNESYKTAAILVDDEMIYTEDNVRKMERYYNIKAGDTVDLKIKEENTPIKISKVETKRPMGYESIYLVGGYLFVSEDITKDLEDSMISSLKIKSSNPQELENKINEESKTNEDIAELNISNLATVAMEQRRIILVISIFLYGFIGVITLIGVTNIFNTISTNMILRSKEFAMLKAIGMTTKEFNKMIRLESILYGIKALLIGIPIGTIGSYLMYKSFAQSIDFGFIIPLPAILISIIFVFIIVGLTMKYSLNKINKQNIIETIRKENI